MENSTEKIAAELVAGNFVTVPTETVFGYAARLDSEAAIRALMAEKERDFGSGKVFTLVPETKEAIGRYALVPEFARELVEKYVPGEITLILPKNPDFKHFYYDHFETIGVRIPDHPLFPALLTQTGALILTSANKRGGTPKSATGHKPSTIVDCTGAAPKIIRQGDLVI